MKHSKSTIKKKSLFEQLFFDIIKLYPSFAIYLGLEKNQKHIENPYTKSYENKY